MSKSDINNYIDAQFPDNNQQLITPQNARNVTKALNDEAFNLEDNDTDDINEGTSNLFFTNERVDDRVAQLVQPSDDGRLTWDYDDTTGELTPVLDLSGIGGGGGGAIDDDEVSDSTTYSSEKSVATFGTIKEFIIVGNGVTTDFDCTHNFNNKRVIQSMSNSSDVVNAYCTVTQFVDHVRYSFGSPPASGVEYHIVICGIDKSETTTPPPTGGLPYILPFNL